jgi:hypothetical protein
MVFKESASAMAAYERRVREVIQRSMRETLLLNMMLASRAHHQDLHLKTTPSETICGA